MADASVTGGPGTAIMALYLEPLNGGRQIVLDKAVVLIGRQSDCDAILDNSRKVSRRHCAIAQVNDRFVIRDLESMNGVTVNGNRVTCEAALQAGDEISIGDVRYVLRDTNAAKGGPVVAKSVAGKPAVPPPPPAAKAPPRPVNISQKFPVPIAEEGVDFAIEPSLQFPQAPLLPHSQPEVGGQRSEVGKAPESGQPGPPASGDLVDEDEKLPDVIILEDSGEFDSSRGRKPRK